MKKILLIILILFSISFGFKGFAQNNDEAYKIMFYNVENLFDTFNDSLKNDEEFLPDGDRYWSKYKYYDKLKNIYKVIIAVGGWNPPAIVAVGEIENRRVLNDLVYNTPLVKYEYQVVHHESPDRRGIDVGLLYRKELFKPVYDKAISINFPDEPNYKTRDILYVKGIANEIDTLHIFVNHWPSRWGGQLESEDNRITAALTLKKHVDSIISVNANSNIIITGDFNDTPINKSLKDILKAKLEFEPIENDHLYNLSYHLQETQNIGSHKYQGEWAMLDQLIISGHLLNQNNPLYTTLNDAHVFNKDFLLEPDESFFGYKPRRTFIGYKYNGGFSDHLPIYLILNFNK